MMKRYAYRRPDRRWHFISFAEYCSALTWMHAQPIDLWEGWAFAVIECGTGLRRAQSSRVSPVSGD
jgi:hypothetical protein